MAETFDINFRGLDTSALDVLRGKHITKRDNDGHIFFSLNNTLSLKSMCVFSDFKSLIYGINLCKNYQRVRQKFLFFKVAIHNLYINTFSPQALVDI